MHPIAQARHKSRYRAAILPGVSPFERCLCSTMQWPFPALLPCGKIDFLQSAIHTHVSMCGIDIRIYKDLVRPRKQNPHNESRQPCEFRMLTSDDLPEYSMEKLENNLREVGFDLPKILLDTGAILSGGGLMSIIGLFDGETDDLDVYVNVHNATDICKALLAAGMQVRRVGKQNAIEMEGTRSEYSISFFRMNKILRRVVMEFPKKCKFKTLDLIICFEDPTAVVRNFDLTCCQNWYDGKAVYYTHKETLKREYYVNTDYLTVARNSAVLLARMEKYDSRGFREVYSIVQNEPVVPVRETMEEVISRYYLDRLMGTNLFSHREVDPVEQTKNLVTENRFSCLFMTVEEMKEGLGALLVDLQEIWEDHNSIVWMDHKKKNLDPVDTTSPLEHTINVLTQILANLQKVTNPTPLIHVYTVRGLAKTNEQRLMLGLPKLDVDETVFPRREGLEFIQFIGHLSDEGLLRPREFKKLVHQTQIRDALNGRYLTFRDPEIERHLWVSRPEHTYNEFELFGRKLKRDVKSLERAYIPDIVDRVVYNSDPTNIFPEPVADFDTDLYPVRSREQIRAELAQFIEEDEKTQFSARCKKAITKATTDIRNARIRTHAALRQAHAAVDEAGHAQAAGLTASEITINANAVAIEIGDLEATAVIALNAIEAAMKIISGYPHTTEFVDPAINIAIDAEAHAAEAMAAATAATELASEAATIARDSLEAHNAEAKEADDEPVAEAVEPEPESDSEPDNEPEGFPDDFYNGARRIRELRPAKPYTPYYFFGTIPGLVTKY